MPVMEVVNHSLTGGINSFDGFSFCNAHTNKLSATTRPLKSPSTQVFSLVFSCSARIVLPFSEPEKVVPR